MTTRKDAKSKEWYCTACDRTMSLSDEELHKLSRGHENKVLENGNRYLRPYQDESGDTTERDRKRKKKKLSDEEYATLMQSRGIWGGEYLMAKEQEPFNEARFGVGWVQFRTDKFPYYSEFPSYYSYYSEH